MFIARKILPRGTHDRRRPYLAATARRKTCLLESCSPFSRGRSRSIRYLVLWSAESCARPKPHAETGSILYRDGQFSLHRRAGSFFEKSSGGPNSFGVGVPEKLATDYNQPHYVDSTHLAADQIETDSRRCGGASSPGLRFSKHERIRSLSFFCTICATMSRRTIWRDFRGIRTAESRRSHACWPERRRMETALATADRSLRATLRLGNDLIPGRKLR